VFVLGGGGAAPLLDDAARAGGGPDGGPPRGGGGGPLPTPRGGGGGIAFAFAGIAFGAIAFVGGLVLPKELKKSSSDVIFVLILLWICSSCR